MKPRYLPGERRYQDWAAHWMIRRHLAHKTPPGESAWFPFKAALLRRAERRLDSCRCPTDSETKGG